MLGKEANVVSKKKNCQIFFPQLQLQLQPRLQLICY